MSCFLYHVFFIFFQILIFNFHFFHFSLNDLDFHLCFIQLIFFSFTVCLFLLNNDLFLSLSFLQNIHFNLQISNLIPYLLNMVFLLHVLHLNIFICQFQFFCINFDLMFSMNNDFELLLQVHSLLIFSFAFNFYCYKLVLSGLINCSLPFYFLLKL